MMKEGRSGVPKDIDEYLATVPVEARVALEKLRRTIRSAAPVAVEGISYRMPSFKYLGPLVAFAAFKGHCSFFPMSAAVVESHREELERYSTSKGTIRFPPDKPLPVALVRRIVMERIRENEAKAAARLRRRPVSTVHGSKSGH
ncbi:MAG: hypothetical protein A3K67_01785 [Euryarchaeota archaeon RBG_16_62_10]|nr:MAG: hypothetical protein A3K67_01785 [Euryarchaeota archaeon RBG_16_62_10]